MMNYNLEAIDEFWLWFLAHRSDFEALTDPENPFWKVAVTQLQRLDLHFRCEVSNIDGKEREFILTAEGHAKVFPLADATIARAPKIAEWQFISLKPAMGFGFEIAYEGTSFDPGSMWFLPLIRKSRPQDLGLRIGVPNLTPEIKRQAENAALVILDTALGERVAALDIQFVEVCSLTGSPETEGYIELPKLAAYIERRKSMR